MRADAARRRESIIREARRLFAAHGGGVPLEAIAEASGVGIATLYRNFESRTALAEEVALAILSDIQRASALALARMGDESGSAWRDYLDSLVELDLGALTVGLADIVADGLSERVRDAQAQTLARTDDVLTAARASGHVRAELTALELVVTIGMITRPQPDAIRAAAPELVDRLLTILLAGMRLAPGK